MLSISPNSNRTTNTTVAHLVEGCVDAPLPWDHIDTGIDKEWLKADLQRALEAATVPDCSFDGCSHCGVCGVDFGHNVAIAALPVPPFAGNFTPNQERVQRLRVWFGKLGEMALVSHLDLARLFDRALRRASLPISHSGGFHPTPRIAIANALSLGATSSGEIVDFELSQPIDVASFVEKLAAQLPPDIPIYKVEVVDLKSASATALLERAEYLITVASDSDAQEVQWLEWVEAIKASDAIWQEQTTKTGKTKQVNLRDRLFELEIFPPLEPGERRGQSVLRYIGSCRNDGTLLRPEQVVFMLEQVAEREFQLLHAHRRQLFLGAM